MEVDQARHHKPAGGIDRQCSALGGDVFLNRFDQTAMDRDITLGAEWP